jgi:hypothetical protein
VEKVSPKLHSGAGNPDLMNRAMGYQSDWPLATGLKSYIVQLFSEFGYPVNKDHASMSASVGFDLLVLLEKL